MAVQHCGGAPCIPDLTNPQPCANPVVEYAGRVLELTERNGYDDSDFMAVVWDAKAGETREVMYGTTRHAMIHSRAAVDATPLVLRAARAWKAEQILAKWEADAQAHANRPRMNARVRSLTTRGKNVGVEGTVRWLDTATGRVGVAVKGENSYRFMDAARVQVLDPEPIDRDGWTEAAATSATRYWTNAELATASR